MPLTKADLVDGVATSAQLSKKEAEVIVNIFLQSLVETIQKGEGIELRGFGSFRFRERGARSGRNPRTGESVHVPAKRVVYFKMGKELKKLLNQDPATPAPALPPPQPASLP
ncbi:MAG: HU family DNA-binding protein [Acidobacteriota bacterium]